MVFGLEKLYFFKFQTNCAPQYFFKYQFKKMFSISQGVLLV